MSLTVERALRAYAAMMNTLNVSHLEPLLADDFHYASMGWLDSEFPGPCVVMAQSEKDNLIGVVLAKVGDGKIKRLDLCFVPGPHLARRTGEYPDEQIPMLISTS